MHVKLPRRDDRHQPARLGDRTDLLEPFPGAFGVLQALPRNRNIGLLGQQPITLFGDDDVDVRSIRHVQPGVAKAGPLDQRPIRAVDVARTDVIDEAPLVG